MIGGYEDHLCTRLRACANVFVRVGARTSVDANIEDSNKAKKAWDSLRQWRDTSGNSAGTGPADYDEQRYPHPI